ncbi:MAG: molybdopterin-dependent oxidoreductase [Chloroflexi bacterium]|nr:molybdopterin-dependent oxidoreductase [Chloroflexota bacterium]
MEKSYNIVGKPLPRIDSPLKAMGMARYVDDMILPGMLWGKICRSPFPHARVLHIDTASARRLTGVKGIITGQDISGKRYGIMPQTADELPLAIDKVRYVGEAVAAVAAIDEEIAAEAVELIEVEYDPLPALFDPEEAMALEAPHIHDKGNISWKVSWEFGDKGKGFGEAFHVREDRFDTQGVNHAPLEPHAAIASVDSGGRLTLWTASQNLLILRRSLAITLGMAEGDIRVVNACVGGGFGGKVEMFSHQFCCALLARQTMRPVKITLSREDVFLATRERHPMILYLKTGVKRDGTLLARECRLIADGGAYTSTGPVAIYLAGAALNLPYRLPYVKYEGYRVYTNKTPSGPQRGHGFVQSCFATESQLDMIATDLGLDPVEIRLRNALQAGDVTPNGLSVGTCGLDQCIKSTIRGFDWKGKGDGEIAKGVGIGCSGYLSGGQFVPNLATTVFLKIHYDGAITVFSGAPDVGQGSDSILAQVVAEELGVSLKEVHVVSADTELTPMDAGSYSSRVTLFVGKAAQRAAREAREKILKGVADTLEANPEDLEARGGRIFVKGSPTRGMSFLEAVRTLFVRQELPIIVTGSYVADSPPPLEKGYGNLSPAYSFAAQVAEVEVDRETGQVKVLRMAAAHDCGFAINPLAVEGQVEGALAGGLGQALSEGLPRSEGQPLNPTFLGYRMPTALDMPATHTITVETDDPMGPFGAKEAGEGMQVTTAAAIANAVANALGSHPTSLPLNPEELIPQ